MMTLWKHRAWVLSLGIAVLLMGCDDYGNSDHNHNPPPGQGSMIIENNTFNGIAVYFNSVRQATVDDQDDRIYDLDPGKYRVVLSELGGDRTYANDIDIVEGSRTIVNVTADPTDSVSYDVAVFID